MKGITDLMPEMTTAAAKATPAEGPVFSRWHPRRWRGSSAPPRSRKPAPNDLVVDNDNAWDRPADEWTTERAFKISGFDGGLFEPPTTPEAREHIAQARCGTVTDIEVIATIDGVERPLRAMERGGETLRRDRLVDAITVALVIKHPGRPAETRRLQSDIAFIGPFPDRSLAYTGVLIAKNTKLAPADAAQLMAEAMFESAEEDPVDQLERQRKQFLDEAAQLATKLLRSADEARHYAIDAAVREHVGPHVPVGDICRITIARGRSVKIEIDPAESRRAG